MPGDFTLYDVVVTDLTPVIKDGTCRAGHRMIGNFFNAWCDANDHIDISRVTVVYYQTPAPGNKCIVTGYHVAEKLHTTNACDKEVLDWIKASDVNMRTIWLAEVTSNPPPKPSRTNHTSALNVPEISYETPATGQTCAAKNDVKIRFEKHCVDNVWVVTRYVKVTIATPIGRGRCHVIRFERRETLNTGKECHELDLVDPSDAAELWAEAAKQRWGQEDRRQSRLTPGTERTAPEPFRSAVAVIVAEGGAPPVPVTDPSRQIFFETPDGKPIVSPGDFPKDDNRFAVFLPPSGRNMIQYLPMDQEFEISLTDAPEALKERLGHGS